MVMDTRTIEVLPKHSNPSGRHIGWVIRGRGLREDEIYDKKKNALDDARELAKGRAKAQQNSVGVKIYGKDGDYQRKNVYEP